MLVVVALVSGSLFFSRAVLIKVGTISKISETDL